MLNGKFFTGLPPKMMERNAGAPNRLESHFFWPTDDSRAEPVQHQKHKRRASLQAESAQCGREGESFQRQASLGDRASEVDTKQRFKKEFASSSIQFYDNIQEEEIGSRRQAIRKPLIRQARKQDIAIKPTAMRLPNDEATVAAAAQEEYAAIKKKQAFDSKIEFYDYADAERIDGNDRRKPKKRLMSKMDINDKKDVERNTKNSPKLQVKGIQRNLHAMDEHRRNNDGHERDRRSYDDCAVEVEQQQQKQQERPRHSTPRFIRNEVQVRGEQRNDIEHSGGRNNNSNNQIYNERINRHRRDNIDDDHGKGYDDDVTEMMHAMQKTFYDDHSPRRGQIGPKRILKNPMNRDEGDFNDQLDWVEHGTRNMRIHQSSPKKHVTYDDDRLEEHNHAVDCDDYGSSSFSNNRGHRRENVDSYSQNDNKLRNRSTNGSRQSPQRQQEQQQQRQQQQQKSKKTTSDFTKANDANDEANNEERRRGNDCSTEGHNASKKPLNLIKSNNNNNNNDNNSNHNQNDAKLNNLSQHQQQKRQREITPKISASPMASASALASDDANSTSTSALSPKTMDFQKHLRSSLCFSGGEIVGNAEMTPTSDSGSRRTARSAATSRRICVGLPD